MAETKQLPVWQTEYQILTAGARLKHILLLLSLTRRIIKKNSAKPNKLLPRASANPSASNFSERIYMIPRGQINRHDMREIACPGPCPAPGDTGVFRERGRTKGLCRVESPEAG